MKYLLVLAAVLALAACEKSGDTNNAPAESSGEAMDVAAPEVMAEGDATVEDMTESMDNTMDDADGADDAAGEMGEAEPESDADAEMKMEQTEE